MANRDFCIEGERYEDGSVLMYCRSWWVGIVLKIEIVIAGPLYWLSERRTSPFLSRLIRHEENLFARLSVRFYRDSVRHPDEV